MIHFILFLVLFNTGTGCSFSTNSVDEFTGARKVYTNDVIIAGSVYSGTVRACVANHDKTIALVFKVYYPEPWSVDVDDVWHLKLSDNSVIQLHATSHTFSEHDLYSWVGIVVLPLRAEDITAILAADVLKIRTPIGWDVEINKKKRSIIAQHLRCVL